MRCPWEYIGGFRSLIEFREFQSWMDQQAKRGIAAQVPVASRCYGFNLEEQWYTHIETSENWRLVWPDPPFAGVFEKVVP
jgi:hypothetical protein